MRIKAGSVSPGRTGAGGWDVEMEIAGNAGEVTLLPDRAGAPTAWGSPDQWVSRNLLAHLEALDGAEYRETLEEIEAVASSTVEQSGVEATE